MAPTWAGPGLFTCYDRKLYNIICGNIIYIMFSNKSIAYSFFTDISNETWQCRCGRRRKQKLKRGYENLMEHNRSDHPIYVDEIRKRAIPIVLKLA